MSDIRQDQFDSDLDFVRQRLVQDAQQITLPPSLRSENLISLLDGLPEDSENLQPSQHGGRFSKRTIYLQFVACAACFTLVFFGFYKVVEYTANGNLVTAPAPHAAPATPRDPAAPTPNGNETALAAADAAAPKMQADTAPKAEPAAVQPVAKSYGEVYQTLDAMLAAELASMEKPHSTNPNVGSANGPEMTDAAAPVMPNFATGGGGSNATAVSRTNTQFGDVDEADLVKTDGRYLYQYRFDNATGEAEVAIVGATNLKLMSTISLDKSESGANTEMYLIDNHLVLVQSAAQERVDETLAPLDMPMTALLPEGETGRELIVPDYYKSKPYPGNAEMMELVVYDVTDRSAPKEANRFAQEGRYVSSRLSDHTVYLVTNKSVRNGILYEEAPLARTVLPVVAENQTARLVDTADILLPPYIESPSYAVISALDLDSGKTSTKAVLGAAGELMMNSDSLFITSNIYDEGANTGITRFVIDKTDVKYVSSGTVSGTIDNQFSLDEYNGNLRIATTSYNREKQANVNNLYVLNQQMEQLGAVENLAEGESIKSVRFMADTAYVVTFRQTDPLFVIDLSDPKKPVVKGELKIPGFSEYLHPIDENTLVGIGYNTLTNARGGVVTDGLKLSLFDVSDPTDPTETASLLLGNIGSESEALSNHRAVMWYPEMRLLGFPATLYTARGATADDPWGGDRTLAFAGYLVVRVNEDGFEVVGQLSNDQSKQGFLRYELDGAIERGLYIGKTFYTTAAGRITAYSIDDFHQIGELVYPK